MTLAPIARLLTGSSFFNAINVRTVTLIFQKSAGQTGATRGIDQLSFQVLKNGAVIQTGTTGADGRIQMRLPGGSATLQLVSGGTPAEYTVTIRDDAIEAATTSSGQQRRLRMLGYQMGRLGADGNGVDGAAAPDVTMDRCLLEFQADDGTIPMNSIADANTQTALTTAAGA